MNNVKSSNPAFTEEVYRRYGGQGGGVIAKPMTVEGTVNKTLILLLLAVISASFTWSQVLSPQGVSESVFPLVFGGIFGAMIVGWVTIFKPSWSPFTAPIYALLEGLGLGAVSALYEARTHGIAVQAVGLTFGVLLTMLVAYRARLIQVTDKFRMGVVAATGGIFLFMVAASLLQWFGVHGPAAMLWYSSSPLAIGVSLVIIVVAALNLALDFDQIERGVNARMPQFMEWYSGFGIMVTLIWLYLRILRLLSQLNRR